MRVIIVGAGIGGLATAIAARREGLEVTVIERAAELLPVGAGIQITPNAARVCDHLGILSSVKQKGVVLDGTTYRSYRDGKVLRFMAGGAHHLQLYKAPWVVIHRADYLEILVETAKSLGTHIQLNATIKYIDFEKTVVHFADGTLLDAEIVVGADGLWSFCRSQITGGLCAPSETGDQAYRGTFTRQQLLALNDSKVTDLCDKKEQTIWLGPGKHAVFYPLQKGEMLNLVLIVPDDLPDGETKYPADIDEMRAHFQDWDETIKKIISCLTNCLKWKLCKLDELESWSKGNVCLLGDACHPTLPYQAQGAAMAVEDAVVLSRLLGRLHKKQEAGGDADNCPTVGAVLKVYESLRKIRTLTNVKGANANRYWNHLEDGPLQEARDDAMLSFKHHDWALLDPAYDQNLYGFDVIEDADKVADAVFGA